MTLMMPTRGAKYVTLDQLNFCPQVEKTSSWNPVPHQEVAVLVKEKLNQNGFNVTRESYGISNKGHRMFGVLDTEHNIVPGVRLAVGIRNSTDKSMSAGFTAGERVLVCSNLSFSGQVVAMEKHVSAVMYKLSENVDRCLEKLPLYTAVQANNITRLQNTEISDQEMSHLLVQAVREERISPKLLLPTAQEWYTPSHEEFQPRTLWSLFNGLTEAIKPAFEKNPERSSKETRLFQRFLLNTAV